MPHFTGADPNKSGPYTTDLLSGKKVPAHDNMVAMHMDPAEVRKTQQFLSNHGFHVALDGVWGPVTASAAATFHSNHNSGEAWSRAHGIGIHPAARVAPPPQGVTPHGAQGDVPASGKTLAAKTTAQTGTAPPSLFEGLLSTLLGTGGQIGSYVDPRLAAKIGTMISPKLGASVGRMINPNAGANVGTMLDPNAGANVGKMLDPNAGANVGTDVNANAMGDAAAAPGMEEAAALQRAIDLNPQQEAQSQADISNWYGLDPNGPGYNLSVLGRLAKSTADSAQTATDAQNNIGDIAKSLAGSIGGSANAGSGMVDAAGANAAGTMGALAQISKQSGGDLASILSAEGAGAAMHERGASQAALRDLMDKHGAALGQATSDRAQAVLQALGINNDLAQTRYGNRVNAENTNNALAQQRFGNRTDAIGANNALAQQRLGNRNDAVTANNSLLQQRLGNRVDAVNANNALATQRFGAETGAVDKNNALTQQRFANLGNLLSTLGQMQAVDPTTADLKTKQIQAVIAKTQAQTNRINHPVFAPHYATPPKPVRAPHIDLANAANSVGGLLGVSTDGAHQLPQGTSVTKLAYTIGSQLQSLGLKKGTPEYQRMAQTLISMFRDPNGRPIVPPKSWFGPGS